MDVQTKSQTPTIDLLTNVLRGSGQKLVVPSLHSPDATVKLPYVGLGGRFTENYALSLDQMGQRARELNVPPQQCLVRNIALSAMRYASAVTIPPRHPFNRQLSHLHAQIVEISKNAALDKTEKKQGKSKVYKQINTLWEERFSRDNPAFDYKKTLDVADELISRAIDELEAKGQLGLRSKSDTLRLGRDYRKAFEKLVFSSRENPIPNEEIFTKDYMYSDTTQRQFLQHKFSTTDPRTYLMMLLESNLSVFDSAAKAANIDAGEMFKLIDILDDNQKADHLKASVAKKASYDGKKNVRGAFSAYIKDNRDMPEVKSVMVNIHHFQGSKTSIESFYLNPLFEDPTNPDSPNEYVRYLKEGSVPNVLHTEDTRVAFEAREIERKQYLAQVQEEVRIQNEIELAKAKQRYEDAQPVTSAKQLNGTYWDKKGLKDEAAAYLTGMRINKSGEVILPLDDTLTETRDIEQCHGFQKILPKKLTAQDGTTTDKLFDGLGDGMKRKAFFTIGDPAKASLIITNEGIANGLLSYVEMKQRKFDVAVICTLDAGNINHAIRAAIAKYPTTPMINVADNDRFNKHGLERDFPAIEVTDEKGEVVDRLENTGKKIATNFEAAIEFPSTFIDFSNINGLDFTEQQRNFKYSDLDDLNSALVAMLMTSGENRQSATEKARKQSGDYLAQRITEKLQTTLSPNWGVDTQHKYRWIASDVNLGKEAFIDFHDIRDSLVSAYSYFKKMNSKGLDYQTYSQLTRAGRDIQISFTDDKENLLMASKSEAVLNNEEVAPSETPQTDKEEFMVIQSIPEVDMNGFDVPSQIYQRKEDIEEQIYGIQQKIENLAASGSDAAHVRIEKHEATLALLTSELKHLDQQLASQKPEQQILDQATPTQDSDSKLQPEKSASLPDPSEKVTLLRTLSTSVDSLRSGIQSLKSYDVNSLNATAQQTLKELVADLRVGLKIIETGNEGDEQLQERIERFSSNKDIDQNELGELLDESNSILDSVALSASNLPLEELEDRHADLNAYRDFMRNATDSINLQLSSDIDPAATTDVLPETAEPEAPQDAEQPASDPAPEAVAVDAEPEPTPEPVEPEALQDAEQPASDAAPEAVAVNAEPEPTPEPVEPEALQDAEQPASDAAPEAVAVNAEPEPTPEPVEPEALQDAEQPASAPAPEAADAEPEPTPEPVEPEALQDAELPASDPAPEAADAEPEPTPEPVEPEALQDAEQPASDPAPEAADAEAEPTPEPVEPEALQDTEQPASDPAPEAADAEPEPTPEPVEPEALQDAELPASDPAPEAVAADAEPEATPEPVEPEAPQDAEPEAIPEPAEPEALQDAEQPASDPAPEAVAVDAEPEATPEPAEPEALQDAEQPASDPAPEAVAVDAEPEATPEPAEPEALQGAERSESDPARESKATQKRFVVHADWNTGNQITSSFGEFTVTQQASPIHQGQRQYLEKLRETLSGVKVDIQTRRVQVETLKNAAQHLPPKRSPTELDSLLNGRQADIQQAPVASALSQTTAQLKTDQTQNGVTSLRSAGVKSNSTQQDGINVAHPVEPTIQSSPSSEAQDVPLSIPKRVEAITKALEQHFGEGNLHNADYKKWPNKLKEELRSCISQSLDELKIDRITNQSGFVEAVNNVARHMQTPRGAMISAAMGVAHNHFDRDFPQAAIRHYVFESLTYEPMSPLTESTIKYLDGEITPQEFLVVAERELPEEQFNKQYSELRNQVSALPEQPVQTVTAESQQTQHIDQSEPAL